MVKVLDFQDFPIYTTDILAAAATYTSGWKRVTYIPSGTVTATPSFSPWARFLKGLVMADQGGTIFVEQSNDGTTVNFQESIPVAAGLAGAVNFNRRIYGAFIRVRFVNGAVAQGTFSLLAYLGGAE